MDIFILGATGYIGNHVAQAFRRVGYRVWGMTRSQEKAKLLARQEIIPVIGDMRNPNSYKKIAQKADVLIHVAADYENNVAELDKKTVEALIDISKNSKQPKTLLYTSIVWVIGNTYGQQVDETASLNPIKIASWRPAVEEMVSETYGVKGIVIRPGCVYGKQGGLTKRWFEAVHGDGIFIGDGKNSWAMVHVDDLAEAYVLAAEKGLNGEIFNVTDQSSSTIEEVAEAVAEIAGYNGTITFWSFDDAKKQMGDLAEAMVIDQQINPIKAIQVLGWKPQHNGFVQDIDLYYESWKAFQEK